MNNHKQKHFMRFPLVSSTQTHALSVSLRTQVHQYTHALILLRQEGSGLNTIQQLRLCIKGNQAWPGADKLQIQELRTLEKLVSI